MFYSLLELTLTYDDLPIIDLCRKTTVRSSIIRVVLEKRNGGSHRPDWVLSEPGIFRCRK